MDFLKKLFGSNDRVVDSLAPMVEAVNSFSDAIGKLSDEALRAKTTEFQKRIADGETEDDLLPEAFAVVREAAHRVIGERHYDVQLLGGAVLHQGKISEMKTGEGKTLTSTLAIYLNALSGKGVHVVTVNDYLASRDANWMGRVFHFLGLTTACILQQGISYRYEPNVLDSNEVSVEHENLIPVTRREAYASDITYGTNNEFGFDYLRDNMVGELSDMVQRELHYAIVDEVDSILIDEARTPLIISAPDAESTKLYERFAKIVPRLRAEADYVLDEKFKTVTLTDDGITRVEELLGMPNLYDQGNIQYVHHLEQSLKAQFVFHLDRDYVVRDGEVLIVDDFTGRIMHGRRYSEGLHQALEAKEGVAVQRESRTLATITFQNYFRLYKKLAGMTGTASTSAEEFSKVYNLDVVTIPTNKTLIRKDLPDIIYKTEEVKFQKIAEEVKRIGATGQPILIGTIAIEKSEYLAALLEREGVKHSVLNAKQHDREAPIIAGAGQKGAVTIATNMAGRGTDIKLGEGVRELGGLVIIGTERHEARRIDNQLRGRAGRQGDPGETRFFISLEDELMRRFAGDRLKNMMNTMGLPDEEPIESGAISKMIESAQTKIEGFNFDIRKHVLEYDDVMNKQRNVIYGFRGEIVRSANTREPLYDIIYDVIFGHAEEMQAGNPEAVDAFLLWVHATFPLTIKRDELAREKGSAEKNAELVFDRVRETYELKVKAEAAGPLSNAVERNVMLQAIDTHWQDYLRSMDALRQGVGLRAYGQRDPLVEYKREAYDMFANLMDDIREEICSKIFRASSQILSFERFMNQLPRQAVHDEVSVLGSRPTGPAAPVVRGGEEVMQAAIKAASTPVRREMPKVGRNDACPCGSGKKYKKCCGANMA